MSLNFMKIRYLNVFDISSLVLFGQVLKAASRKRAPDDVDDDAEEVVKNKPKRTRAPKAKPTAVKAKSAPKTPAETAHVSPPANAAPEPSEAAEPNADGSAGDPQPKKKPGKTKEKVDLAPVFAEKE